MWESLFTLKLEWICVWALPGGFSAAADTPSPHPSGLSEKLSLS